MKWLRRTREIPYASGDHPHKFTLGRLYPAEVKCSHYVIVCDNGNKFYLVRKETDSYYNWEVVTDDVG